MCTAQRGGQKKRCPMADRKALASQVLTSCLSVCYKQSTLSLWRLMGRLIGVYSSQQDLVSDNLGPLCTWKCRLVVKLWSPLKG